MASPFDRLATETRLRIFGFALYHDVPLSPSVRGEVCVMSTASKKRDSVDKGEKINVSLLLLSKDFHHEALDAFYQVNLIRLHRPKQLQLLTNVDKPLPYLVQHLELVNLEDNSPWWFRGAVHLLPSLLKWCRELPKLKTITLGCDELGRYGSGWTVRRYVKEMLNIDDVECLDIGHYKLGGEYSHVHFKHRRLMDRWQNFQQRSPDYDVVAEVSASTATQAHVSDIGMIVYASRLDFNIWATLYDEAYIRLKNSHNPKDIQEPELDQEAREYLQLKNSYIRRFMFGVFTTPFIGQHSQYTGSKEEVESYPELLRNLSSSSESKDLEHASEMLSANVHMLEHHVKVAAEAAAEGRFHPLW